MNDSTTKNWIAKVYLVAAVLIWSSAASAAVIFDNGAFSGTTPQKNANYSGSSLRMFEDFILNTDAKLHAFEWNGGEYQHTGISRVTEANIVIYAGDAPGIGTSLYTYSGAPIASFVGTFDTSDRFDYAMTGLDVDLVAGIHYWIGLNVTLTGSFANWSNTAGTTSTIGGLYQFRSNPIFSDHFFLPSDNGAFRLIGEPSVTEVPLPSTLTLVGLGLAGFALVRRASRS